VLLGRTFCGINRYVMSQALDQLRNLLLARPKDPGLTSPAFGEGRSMAVPVLIRSARTASNQSRSLRVQRRGCPSLKQADACEGSACLELGDAEASSK